MPWDLSTIQPDIVHAATATVDRLVTQNLSNYTPTPSDWPWHIQAAPPTPTPSDYITQFYDITGSPSPLSVDTSTHTVSFTFTVTLHLSPPSGTNSGSP